MGMKQILLILAVVLVGCGEKATIADPFVEKAIRKSLEKSEGQLTAADLEKVTSLRLPFPQITDVGLKELAKLQNLEELYLYRTQITDAGLKEVAKLQGLEQLFLDYTKVTDDGLKNLTNLQNLHYLSLHDTKITDAGLAELKKALPNCTILVL